jgi:hypothetical protein
MSLMSNDKFAEALRSLGVEPETKTSPATGLQTYAFAKSDPFMIALSEHEDERVQALAAARIGHKSTLEQTRTEKLLRISKLQWPEGARWFVLRVCTLGGELPHPSTVLWGAHAPSQWRLGAQRSELAALHDVRRQA